jgi:hypothetical protein
LKTIALAMVGSSFAADSLSHSGSLFGRPATQRGVEKLLNRRRRRDGDAAGVSSAPVLGPVHFAGRHVERVLGECRGFVLCSVDHAPNVPPVRRRSTTSRGTLAISHHVPKAVRPPRQAFGVAGKPPAGIIHDSQDGCIARYAERENRGSGPGLHCPQDWS